MEETYTRKSVQELAKIFDKTNHNSKQTFKKLQVTQQKIQEPKPKHDNQKLTTDNQKNAQQSFNTAKREERKEQETQNLDPKNKNFQDQTQGNQREFQEVKNISQPFQVQQEQTKPLEFENPNTPTHLRKKSQIIVGQLKMPIVYEQPVQEFEDDEEYIALQSFKRSQSLQPLKFGFSSKSSKFRQNEEDQEQGVKGLQVQKQKIEPKQREIQTIFSVSKSSSQESTTQNQATTNQKREEIKEDLTEIQQNQNLSVKNIIQQFQKTSQEPRKSYPYLESKKIPQQIIIKEQKKSDYLANSTNTQQKATNNNLQFKPNQQKQIEQTQQIKKFTKSHTSEDLSKISSNSQGHSKQNQKEEFRQLMEGNVKSLIQKFQQAK